MQMALYMITPLNYFLMICFNFLNFVTTHNVIYLNFILVRTTHKPFLFYFYYLMVKVSLFNFYINYKTKSPQLNNLMIHTRKLQHFKINKSNSYVKTQQWAHRVNITVAYCWCVFMKLSDIKTNLIKLSSFDCSQLVGATLVMGTGLLLPCKNSMHHTEK